jgi:hypothetical protein
MTGKTWQKTRFHCKWRALENWLSFSLVKKVARFAKKTSIGTPQMMDTSPLKALGMELISPRSISYTNFCRTRPVCTIGEKKISKIGSKRGSKIVFDCFFLFLSFPHIVQRQIGE